MSNKSIIEIREAIAHRIKEYRRLKGYYQKDLAARLNITRPMLASYEEIRATPSIAICEQLCKMMEITMEELTCKIY